MTDFDVNPTFVEGKKGIGPEMEFRCPKCNSLCLIVRLTKSILNFQLECHKCGFTGNAEDLCLKRAG
jgi:predicted RNA-binding Zn-ribbon protein involved in translation (DUF1610 family)